MDRLKPNVTAAPTGPALLQLEAPPGFHLEKRRYPRHPIRWRLQCTVYNDIEDRFETCRATAINAAPGGLQLHCSRPFDIGSPVLVRVERVDGSPDWQARELKEGVHARVVWCCERGPAVAAGGYRLGIAYFDRIDSGC